MGQSFHTHRLFHLFSVKHYLKGDDSLTHSFRFGLWRWRTLTPMALGLMALLVPVSGCTSVNSGQTSTSNPVATTDAKQTNPPSSTSSGNAGGTVADDPALTESAYLDELLQQGFTSKDFWQMRFEHLYITFDGKGRTIDLSDGDEPLSAILSQWQGNEANGTNTSDGKTNQLSGRIIKATSGPSQGYGIYLQGKAYRESSQVAFTIKLDQEFLVKCSSQHSGKPKADTALSLRLENLFGDARLPPDGPVNRMALGFDPLAGLAEKNTLVVDMATLRQKLAPESLDTLERQLARLIYLGDQACETKAGS